MEGTEQLQLIFHGPKDDSVETLRKVKGAFIGELGLSVEEVKQFLESTPAIIFSTAEASEAYRIVHILENAGALVEVGEDDNAHLGAEDEQSFEFTLEFDDLAEESSKGKEPSPTRIYTLDFNPDLEHGSGTDKLRTDGNTLEFEGISPIPDEAELPEKQQHEESSFANDATEFTTEEDTRPLTAESSRTETPLLSFEADGSATDTTDTQNEWNLEAPLSLHIEQEADQEETPESAPEPPAPEWNLSFESKTQLSDNEDLTENNPSADSGSTTELVAGDVAESSPILSAEIDSFEEVLFELPDEPALSTCENSLPVSAPEGHSLSSSDDVLPSSPLHEAVEDELPLGSLGITPDDALTTRRKRHQSAHRRGLFLRGLGLGFILCLAAVNGFLFWERMNIEPTVPAFVENTLENEKPLSLFSTATDRETKPQSPSLKKQPLKGSAITPFGTVWLDVIVRNGTLVSGEISFSAEQPKPLTKKEVVEGISPRPWLHNTEFSTPSFSTSQAGMSIAEGSIKLFIEQGRERFREIGYMRLITSYNPDVMQLSGTMILLKDNKQALPTAPGFRFSGDQAQGLTLEAQIPFSIQFDR